MKRRLTAGLFLFLTALLLLAPPTTASAQGLFGGKGIGGTPPASQMPGSWTSRAASQPESTGLSNPFSGWFKQKPAAERKPLIQLPKFEMPKFEMPSFPKPATPNLFSGNTPSWLPQRDPNAPSLWEKMTQKSKEMADRTSNWFKSTPVDDFSRPTTASWDDIREEMERIQRNRQQQQNSGGVNPDVRSARTPSQPRYRY